MKQAKLQKPRGVLSLVHKSIALFLCLCIASSPIHASAIVPSESPAPNHTSQTTIPEMSIPKELGSVDEFHQGTNGKTILYIQDAHDSLEAQENIAKMIHYLVENYGVKTVFEEGYEGKVPTDEFFSIFKDPRAKEKVSYFLMDKLRLGGAEYAHINRTKNFDLIGVDSIKLHKENIEWYKKSAEKREIIEKDLEAIHKEIKVLVNQYFPKEIKEWMKLKKRFHENKLDLLNYVKRMIHLMPRGGVDPRVRPGDYPSIKLLILAESSQDARILEQASNIAARSLFEEIDRFENHYADSFLTLSRDLKLYRIHKALQLLKRLNRIEVTPEEFDLVKKALLELNTKKIAEFLFEVMNKPVILSNLWEKHIQSAIRFYDTAEARDGLLEKGLNGYSESSDSHLAVLVFGGFHKNRIKSILNKKNFSYLIIAPRITEISDVHRDYYKHLMGGGYHPFEMPFFVAQAAPAERVLEMMQFAINRFPDYVAQSDIATHPLVEQALAAHSEARPVEEAPWTTLSLPRSEVRVPEGQVQKDAGRHLLANIAGRQDLKKILSGKPARSEVRFKWPDELFVFPILKKVWGALSDGVEMAGISPLGFMGSSAGFAILLVGGAFFIDRIYRVKTGKSIRAELTSDPNQKDVEAFFYAFPIRAIPLIILFGPLFETILHNATLLPLLMGEKILSPTIVNSAIGFRALFAFIFSTFLFAMTHPSSKIGLYQRLWGGFVFNLAYLSTGNIWIPAIAHSVINSLAIAPLIRSLMSKQKSDQTKKTEDADEKHPRSDDSPQIGEAPSKDARSEVRNQEGLEEGEQKYQRSAEEVQAALFNITQAWQLLPLNAHMKREKEERLKRKAKRRLAEKKLRFIEFDEEDYYADGGAYRGFSRLRGEPKFLRSGMKRTMDDFQGFLDGNVAKHVFFKGLRRSMGKAMFVEGLFEFQKKPYSLLAAIDNGLGFKLPIAQAVQANETVSDSGGRGLTYAVHEATVTFIVSGKQAAIVFPKTAARAKDKEVRRVSHRAAVKRAVRSFRLGTHYKGSMVMGFFYNQKNQELTRFLLDELQSFVDTIRGMKLSQLKSSRSESRSFDGLYSKLTNYLIEQHGFEIKSSRLVTNTRVNDTNRFPISLIHNISLNIVYSEDGSIRIESVTRPRDEMIEYGRPARTVSFAEFKPEGGVIFQMQESDGYTLDPGDFSIELFGLGVNPEGRLYAIVDDESANKYQDSPWNKLPLSFTSRSNKIVQTLTVFNARSEARGAKRPVEAADFERVSQLLEDLGDSSTEPILSAVKLDGLGHIFRGPVTDAHTSISEAQAEFSKVGTFESKWIQGVTRALEHLEELMDLFLNPDHDSDLKAWAKNIVGAVKGQHTQGTWAAAQFVDNGFMTPELKELFRNSVSIKFNEVKADLAPILARLESAARSEARSIAAASFAEEYGALKGQQILNFLQSAFGTSELKLSNMTSYSKMGRGRGIPDRVITKTRPYEVIRLEYNYELEFSDQNEPIQFTDIQYVPDEKEEVRWLPAFHFLMDGELQRQNHAAEEGLSFPIVKLDDPEDPRLIRPIPKEKSLAEMGLNDETIKAMVTMVAKLNNILLRDQGMFRGPKTDWEDYDIRRDHIFFDQDPETGDLRARVNHFATVFPAPAQFNEFHEQLMPVLYDRPWGNAETERHSRELREFYYSQADAVFKRRGRITQGVHLDALESFMEEAIQSKAEITEQVLNTDQRTLRGEDVKAILSRLGEQLKTHQLMTTDGVLTIPDHESGHG